ncbi:hypothetical protein Tco_0442996, partial [Tanacetum coccineum]
MRMIKRTSFNRYRHKSSIEKHFQLVQTAETINSLMQLDLHAPVVVEVQDIEMANRILSADSDK